MHSILLDFSRFIDIPIDIEGAVETGRAIGARFPLDWKILNGAEIPEGYELVDTGDLPPGVRVVRRTQAAELESLRAELETAERTAAEKRARIARIQKEIENGGRQ